MRYSRIIILSCIFLAALFVAYYAWAQSRTISVTASVQPPAFVDKTDPNDLLPDMVPLPPKDIKIVTRDDGAIMLLFSTTYYNQGRGRLELRGDPKTKGVRADIERDVLQRIYKKDGSYREKVVGTFLWHQQHQHYHFADFVTYDLEAVDAPNHPDLSGIKTKTTFCLRDVSRVELELPNRDEEAAYRVCYKELQGVSVGWGDTYFYDYPDQGLNISELTSGTYRLSFNVNPEHRLEEVRYDNNTSNAVIKIDMEAKTAQVIEQTPGLPPHVEHIHLEQPFGLGI